VYIAIQTPSVPKINNKAAESVKKSFLKKKDKSLKIVAKNSNTIGKWTDRA
jgi:hypothetical protein